MKPRVLLLLVLCLGCATRAPPPSTPLARCRVKTDLGFLDDPVVQQKVAAREAHRKRLKPLNERFNAAALRLLAVAQVFQQTEPLPTATCPSETQLFHLSADRAPRELIEVQRQGSEVVRRLEDADAYAAADNGVDQAIASLERSLAHFELMTDLAAGALKRLLACKGIEVRITHPIDGRVLFSTDGEEGRLTPTLERM